MGWVVKATSRLFFLRERVPVTNLQEAGWEPGSLWKCAGRDKISFLHQSSNGDLPDRRKCYTDCRVPTTFRLAPYTNNTLFSELLKFLSFSLWAKIVLLGNNVAFAQKLFSQYTLCSKFNKIFDRRANFLFKCVRNLWQGKIETVCMYVCTRVW